MKYAVEGRSRALADNSNNKEALEVATKKVELQTEKRRVFFLKLLMMLVFYPLVPTAYYILLLWGHPDPNKLLMREEMAHQLHSNAGGFEAPLQLTITIWLWMKGVLYDEFSFEVERNVIKDAALLQVQSAAQPAQSLGLFGCPDPWPSPFLPVFCLVPGAQLCLLSDLLYSVVRNSFVCNFPRECVHSTSVSSVGG